ncbi:hypothetical protein P8C59_000456 [Phyllachora maydis]|uniref:Uncharacterized protein n=1 Tax=Phyllachora maydis TaxID=1825666 RepID=A0AAD9M7M3_9PEZI|nr:hypothetical protein P8C59_000456 [Phyllachora maydis]
MPPPRIRSESSAASTNSAAAPRTQSGPGDASGGGSNGSQSSQKSVKQVRKTRSFSTTFVFRLACHLKMQTQSRRRESMHRRPSIRHRKVLHKT